MEIEYECSNVDSLAMQDDIQKGQRMWHTVFIHCENEARPNQEPYQ